MDVGGGLVTIANNMIGLGYDSLGNSVSTACTIRGITKNASNASIYFNSVYIGGYGVGGGSSNSFAFQRTGAANDDVRDNIFVNNRSNGSSGGKHYQVFLINTTTLNLNNNVYYGSGNGSVFGSSNNGSSDVTAYASGWTGSDIGSFVTDPQFVNPTGGIYTADLHISATIPTAIERSGVNIASIVDDFDGQLRASYSPEDIGADAGNFILNDLIAPLISVPSPLSNTASTGNRSVNATITDATGIPFTGIYRPRVYYRKSTSATYVSSQGLFVSGTPQSSNWSFPILSSSLGGVSSGDSIYYFIVAQDSVSPPNMGSLPAGAGGSDVNSVTAYPALAFGYKCGYGCYYP